MSALHKLKSDIDVTKRELKNIRQEVLKQKATVKLEAENLKALFNEIKIPDDIPIKELQSSDENISYPMTPIGYITSSFLFKNGIPRQPSLCPTAKATLKIEKSVFNNPEHSLFGLNEFSHIWILFVFHENGHAAVKAKVHPPRLNGASVGVFSTRSPHRPSPLGLSLTKIDKIEGDTIYLSGIDVLNGTPVLDIKPYIPMYDNPILFQEGTSDSQEVNVKDDEKSSSMISGASNKDELSEENTSSETEEKSCVSKNCYKVPEFLKETSKLEVLFTNRALKDLDLLPILFKNEVPQSDIQCSPSDIKQSIIEVLQNDPRSVYRREKCTDRLYYFYINNIHITCWFDDSIAEVLRIKLASAV